MQVQVLLILIGHLIIILACYVFKCGSKNGYLKDMCLNEIGLRAQNMIPNLKSIVKAIGEPR